MDSLQLIAEAATDYMLDLNSLTLGNAIPMQIVDLTPEPKESKGERDSGSSDYQEGLERKADCIVGERR